MELVEVPVSLAAATVAAATAVGSGCGNGGGRWDGVGGLPRRSTAARCVVELECDPPVGGP